MTTEAAHMGRLSHTERHPGVYTNSQGRTRQAYVKYEAHRNGFRLYGANGKAIAPKAYKTIWEMQKEHYFILSPRREVMS